jgi:acyl-CoA reductase-like NAD-dependent aldehyde dehydrogenase
MSEKYGNFINGKWVKPNHNHIFKSFNPANFEEVIGEFVDSNETDVNEAVNAAQEAASNWAKTPGPERSAILQKVINAIAENKQKLAEIMTKEQGKPMNESLKEIQKSIAEANFMTGEGYRLYGKTVPSEREHTWAHTIRVPVGPVAVITPWNFPVLTPMRKMIPALITGNSVVIKPSEFTPLTGLKLIEIIHSTDLPKGVLNAITGGGETGKHLVRHPSIRAISFTGSTQTGRNINKIAAERLVRVQAEMGGKNPVVIWDPSDLDDAIGQTISAAFLCTGQRCTAISRIIVPRADKEQIEKAFMSAMDKFLLGNGFNKETNLGPLISEKQLNIVQGFVERAAKQGAKILKGGKRSAKGELAKGYFYPATLVSDVDDQMEIGREEVFGPVLCIQPVDTFEEAIQVANHTEYGLTSAIFTKHLNFAGQFADGIHSGMVHVNQGTTPESHMPFGGLKASGIGQGSVGPYTIDFFTDIKSIYIKHS